MWKRYWAKRALKKKIAKLFLIRLKKKDSTKHRPKRKNGRKNMKGLLESVKEDPLENVTSSENSSFDEEQKNCSSLVPIS
jgi:hypothetical protein